MVRIYLNNYLDVMLKNFYVFIYCKISILVLSCKLNDGCKIRICFVDFIGFVYLYVW